MIGKASQHQAGPGRADQDGASHRALENRPAQSSSDTRSLQSVSDTLDRLLWTWARWDHAVRSLPSCQCHARHTTVTSAHSGGLAPVPPSTCGTGSGTASGRGRAWPWPWLQPGPSASAWRWAAGMYPWWRRRCQQRPSRMPAPTRDSTPPSTDTTPRYTSSSSPSSGVPVVVEVPVLWPLHAQHAHLTHMQDADTGRVIQGPQCVV